MYVTESLRVIHLITECDSIHVKFGSLPNCLFEKIRGTCPEGEIPNQKAAPYAKQDCRF